ncbi:MAG TPA: hypothetical protein VF167_15360 [Longimicrobiaceae bacterium]
MYATPTVKPRLRRMFAAGRIPPRRRTCATGHRGPWIAAPEYGAWVERLAAETGARIIPARYGQCQNCGSHTAMPEGAEVVE